MPSGKWRLFCLGRNVLIIDIEWVISNMIIVSSKIPLQLKTKYLISSFW